MPASRRRLGAAAIWVLAALWIPGCDGIGGGGLLGLRLRGGAGTPGLAMGEMVGRALKRGQEAADAGALEAAIEAFTSGLDLDPTCGRLYALRAETHLRMDNVAAALRDATTAKELTSRLLAEAQPRPQATYQGQAVKEEGEDYMNALTSPNSGTVQVVFRIRWTPVDALHGGEAGPSISVIGNVPSLGGWIPEQGVPLHRQRTSPSLWEARVDIPAGQESALLYKYAVWVEWEGGEEGGWEWEHAVATRQIPVRRLLDAQGGELVLDDMDFDKDSAQLLRAPSRAGGDLDGRSGALTLREEDGVVARAEGPAMGEVTFQVVCNTNFGEEVYLTGADSMLGEWVPERGIKLATTASHYPLWMTKVSLEAGRKLYNYKYVIKLPDSADRGVSSSVWQWEDRIPDRELIVDGTASLVNDGRFNVAQRHVTFHKLPLSGKPPEIPHGRTVAAWAGQAAPSGESGGGATRRAQTEEVLRENDRLQEEILQLQRLRHNERQELQLLRSQGAGAGSGAVATGLLSKVHEKLQDVSEARAKLVEKADLVELQVKAMRGETAINRDKVAEMEAELTGVYNDTATLETQIKAAEASLLDVRESATTFKTDLENREEARISEGAASRIEVMDLAKQLTLLDKQVEECESVRRALEARVQTLQQEIIEARAEAARSVQDNKKEIASLREMCRSFKEHLANDARYLRGNVSLAEDLATGLEANASSLETSGNLSLSRVQAAKRKVHSLQREEGQKEGELKAKTAEEKERMLAHQSLVTELAALKERLTSSAESLHGMKQRVAAGVATLAQLHTTNNETRLLVANAQEELQGLDKDCGKVEKDEKSRLENLETLEAMLAVAAEQAEQMREIEGTRDALRLRLQEEEETNEGLAQGADVVETAMDEADVALSTLRAEVKTCQEVHKKQEAAIKDGKILQTNLQMWLGGNFTETEELQAFIIELKETHEMLTARLSMVTSVTKALEDRVSNGEVPRDMSELREVADRMSQLEEEETVLQTTILKTAEACDVLNATIIKNQAKHTALVAHLSTTLKTEEMSLASTISMQTQRAQQRAFFQRQLNEVRLKMSVVESELTRVRLEVSVLERDRSLAFERAEKLARNCESERVTLTEVQEAIEVTQSVLQQNRNTLKSTRLAVVQVEQLAQKVRAKRGHTDHMLSRAQTQFDEAARLLEEKKRLESRTNAEIDALKAELEAEQDNALSMSLNLREAAKTAVEEGNEQAATLGFIISSQEKVDHLQSQMLALDEEHDTLASEKATKASRITEMGEEAVSLKGRESSLGVDADVFEAKQGYLNRELEQLRTDVAKMELEKTAVAMLLERETSGIRPSPAGTLDQLAPFVEVTGAVSKTQSDRVDQPLEKGEIERELSPGSTDLCI